jgi:PXA domain
LILLKWTRILAHTFKIYRALRKKVKAKQLAHHAHVSGSAEESSRTKSQSRRGLRKIDTPAEEGGEGVGKPRSYRYVPVSEIAMIREFLREEKFHRAVTFGLDVTPFLFTDASGEVCGKPKKAADGTIVVEEDDKSHPNFTNDDVLAARLFETNLLSECELDYNRVIGHRMVRALVSRQDLTSNIVSTLLTEIMGGCVLTPIMSLFSPDYLNSWIISGLSKSEETECETSSVDADGEEKSDGATTAGTRNEGGVGSEAVPAGATVERVLGDGRDQRLKHEKCSNGSIDITKTHTKASDEEPRPRALLDDSGGAGNAMYSPHSANTARSGPHGASGSRGLSIDSQSAPNTVALPPSSGDSITTMLAKALIDLRQFMDFEEFRDAKESNHEVNVDWDGDDCRAAVVRLVLVVEAALTHGRCTYKNIGQGEDAGGAATNDDDLNELDESERPVEVTLPEYESSTLTQILMELTSDIDAFEERVAAENAMMQEKFTDRFEGMIPEVYQLTATEQSTLRTLIAAWLHTGQIYRTVTLLVQAHSMILAPYYHKTAFLRSKENATGFVRQLRALQGVEILVDTMSVLASPRLEDTNSADLFALVKKSAQSPGMSSLHDEQHQGDTITTASTLPTLFTPPSSTPRYLDFNRNASLAASLRSERERRMESWERIVKGDADDGLPFVHRTRGASAENIAIHKELHHIAKIFYGNTNMLALRDAARRTSVEVEGGSQSLESQGADGSVHVSLMTVETVCQRRRIEIPDDDSSFLLRAQVSHSGELCNGSALQFF